MTGVVVTGLDRRTAVGHWLQSAALDPQRAREEWAERGFTLLECGTLFSAVRIPADLVHAAVETHDPSRVSLLLGLALGGGPVIVDPVSRRYYALVPGSTALRWDVAETLCLGRASCLGVPSPARITPRRGHSHWAVPMDSPGYLCVPGEVAQLVERGRALRTEVAR
ncbi:hypothetical protein ACH5AL_15350 [Actinacidiphila glaucinigra]|uniref:hypothetical protein n=1 Tax=Actinacidiphila glaucinigra TaxID=235986 RepID=UPI0037AB0F51